MKDTSSMGGLKYWVWGVQINDSPRDLDLPPLCLPLAGFLAPLQDPVRMRGHRLTSSVHVWWSDCIDRSDCIDTCTLFWKGHALTRAPRICTKN